MSHQTPVVACLRLGVVEFQGTSDLEIHEDLPLFEVIFGLADLLEEKKIHPEKREDGQRTVQWCKRRSI